MTEETQPEPTLSDLFSMDPRQMTKEHRTEVVRQLREARDKWTSERQNSKAEGRRAKTSQGLSKAKVLKGVPLDDSFFSDIEG